MTLSLADSPVGTKGIISSIDDIGTFRRRIQDLGIFPGCEIYVTNKAPLGDPLSIKVRGAQISLRKTEAKKIMIKVI